MIGELDLFQKEHELSTLLAKCQPGGSSSTAAAKAASQNGTATGHGQPMDFPTGSPSTTGSVHSTDEIDGTMTRTIKTPATTPYEGQSIGSGSAENGSFNGSFDEDVTNNGFENPSFRYMNNSQQQQQQNGHAANSGSVAGSQEIILIQDGELSGDTQKYLQDNSEIVTLRCKDTQRQSMEKKNYASIGLGGIGNDNLIVTKGRTSAGGSNGDGKGGNGHNNNNNNNNQQQRLSSFKADAGSASSSPQRSSGSGISTLKRNHSQNYSCDKVVTGNNSNPMAVLDQSQGQQQPGVMYSCKGNTNGELSVMEPMMMQQVVVQVSPDGKLRNKPTVSPRPTSLSGSLLLLFCFYFYFSFRVVEFD